MRRQQLATFTVLCCCTGWIGSVAVARNGGGQDDGLVSATPQRGAGVAAGIIPVGGWLLIPESTNRRVMAFSPLTGDLVDANFIGTDVVNLTTPINALPATDPNFVLVSDQIVDVVQAFSASSGVWTSIFAPAGGANTAVLDNVRGIEFAPNGNLLATVGGGGNVNSIAQFDASGATLPVFIAAGSGGLIAPFDIHRIRQTMGALTAGEYLVSSSTDGVVRRYSSGGAFISNFADPGTFSEQITQAANGNILVAVFNSVAEEGIWEYLPDGTFVARLDNATTGGYRGVYELPGGSILATTAAGVFELDRVTGAILSTKIGGVSARFVEFAPSDVIFSNGFE